MDLYNRPDLTPEERSRIVTRAHMIARTRKFENRTELIAAILMENAKLSKECQEHRRYRGIDPLMGYPVPIYQGEK